LTEDHTASARVLEKAGYTFVNEEYGAEDDPYGNGMLVYKNEAG
jgi:ribosomal-protein-alanine N-acetyltransferase